MPQSEIVCKDTTVDTTSSETDIPNGKGFGYAPKVYTDLKYAANLSPTATKFSESEVVQKNFYRRVLCKMY